MIKTRKVDQIGASILSDQEQDQDGQSNEIFNDGEEDFEKKGRKRSLKRKSKEGFGSQSDERVRRKRPKNQTRLGLHQTDMHSLCSNQDEQLEEGEAEMLED